MIAVSAFAGGCVAHEVTHVSVAEAQAVPANVPRWEYKTIEDRITGVDINALGRQGWDIASCPGAMLCIMKRPL